MVESQYLGRFEPRTMGFPAGLTANSVMLTSGRAGKTMILDNPDRCDDFTLRGNQIKVIPRTSPKGG
jgi:hypothetical protein